VLDRSPVGQKDFRFRDGPVALDPISICLPVLAVLAIAAALLRCVGIWATRHNHRHSPGIDDQPGLEATVQPLPSVLVVVPARDEERNIAGCLDALCRSEYPRLRIRIVDDGSTARTADIASAIARRDPRVELVTAGPLPEGWLGKNHALWVGTRGADEDWLLFVDADLRVEPSCIARAVAAAHRMGADLLTLQPKTELLTFWEIAVQAVVIHFIAIMLNTSHVNSEASPLAAAFGPFMLFRRTAYQAVGGHQAVRAQLVEDLRLAQAVKRARLRLVLARGTRLATLRMYDSLGTIVHGWSKNFYVSVEGKWWAMPIMVIGILFVYGVPWIALAIGLARGEWATAAAGGFAVIVAIVARWDFARLYGVSQRGTAAYMRQGVLEPLGALVLSWILVWSVLRAACRLPATWKGRAVP
jgi:chlorobactene glucosyltransferase